ncbi:MAG: methylmalonyl Co-A mutase-associated GTPase MeaB [Sulfobacillus thermosulfidooxidans]|uniref:methylmalonyl Co-A mutase-associated GTPase MeaB n=1 Tax=Sulfobacillus sp. hq2 TaxID=2039167 RepID=UPI000CD21667|nr:methylmalonyl Co-A mutase-associated GTPase MeaB [Sulfobacillus sp. hq2]MCY0907517.1 methylmalonyl Co-A mutase-associated GTPase MeaB [Sulfobacillus thermotolerans]POB10690.1 methylmalonyl Co-A mutase-associated GTPase MeaB [Sulfobacillus sp. hq2]PSR36497.1 MAG: methylmalonyl Co-A mutase-associated GTPase MeaB [Sulfobacillus thermosulfidooxidans]
MMDLETVYQGIQEGRRRALARGLSWVDEGSDRGNALLGRLFPHAGHAHVIGITGAPGVGKSTLVNALTLHLRKTKQTVGILAVDPSSPFTGGAILGDRIRMQDSVDDQGVYMRSLASRGHVGGLSRATFGALTLLDAAGFDVILIETVGAGQAEVDVMRFAQTVLVVLAPGLGDDIQAIKAGILEIGNIFVVNKGDREGADRTVRSLRSMLGLTSTSLDWVPPIIKTSADRNEGIGELVQAIEDHKAYLTNHAIWDQMRERQAENLLEQALEDMVEAVKKESRRQGEWYRAVSSIRQGESAPAFARELISQWLQKNG